MLVWDAERCVATPQEPFRDGKLKSRGTVVRWKAVPASALGTGGIQLTANIQTFPLVYQWNQAPGVLGWRTGVENPVRRSRLINRFFSSYLAIMPLIAKAPNMTSKYSSSS